MKVQFVNLIDQRNPLISIVVTTKNEQKHIRKCLQSIRDQKYPKKNIEIIVIDNNSNDNTKGIAREFTNKVYNKGPERSAQRNFGSKKSKGKYYMYLDADMSLSPSVIVEALEKFTADKKLVGLYIPEIIVGKGLWLKVRKFERSFYNATVVDCVRIIRKATFDKIGGFDETLTGPEDWDLDKKVRLAGRISIIKSPLYHNEAGFSIINYLNKKSYYARSFNKYIKRWGNDDPDIKKQLGFYYRYFIVFVENGNWKKLLKHPLLSLQMFFLKFLVGLIYIKSSFINRK